MSTTHNTEVRVMSEQQIVEAVRQAIHFSNSMDCAVRRSVLNADFERNWARLGAFMTSMAMSLDAKVPGLFAQICDFQEDVAFGRNPLADERAAAAAKEQSK